MYTTFHVYKHFSITFQDVSTNFGSTMTPDEPVDLLLDAVSYIGVILSIFGLLLTIISYVITKLVMVYIHSY